MKLENQISIKKTLTIAMLFFSIMSFSQNKALEIEGVIMDENNVTIPYVAVNVEGTYIGTSSTDDGGFYLALSKKHLEGSLAISSIGYESTVIKIKDFIAQKEKVIILKESITSLSEIEVKHASSYVKEALKRLKENTISDTHMLKMLYRRASIEDGEAKFLVEHYMKVLDKGPSANTVKKIEVAEGRKSADYRIAKDKQHSHAINYMVKHNPLRTGLPLKNFKWKKTGDTNYDGEDVLIIEGRKGKYNYRRFYIGIDTFKVYKIETSVSNAVFIYKKNDEGKLYLSYHNRAWNKPREQKLDEHTRKLMGKNAPESIMVAYRQEVYVLGVETNKKNMNVESFGGFGTDIGDVKVRYDAMFWKNFSVPPDTKFFKKIKTELQDNFGVPLETQFQYANKM